MAGSEFLLSLLHTFPVHQLGISNFISFYFCLDVYVWLVYICVYNIFVQHRLYMASSAIPFIFYLFYQYPFYLIQICTFSEHMFPYMFSFYFVHFYSYIRLMFWRCSWELLEEKAWFVLIDFLIGISTWSPVPLMFPLWFILSVVGVWMYIY